MGTSQGRMVTFHVSRGKDGKEQYEVTLNSESEVTDVDDPLNKGRYTGGRCALS